MPEINRVSPPAARLGLHAPHKRRTLLAPQQRRVPHKRARYDEEVEVGGLVTQVAVKRRAAAAEEEEEEEEEEEGREAGFLSRKEKRSPSSSTTLAGASPFRMRKKMLSGSGASTGPRSVHEKNRRRCAGEATPAAEAEATCSERGDGVAAAAAAAAARLVATRRPPLWRPILAMASQGAILG